MATAALTNPPEHYMPLAEVIERIGLSRSSIYRMMEAGTFPRPLRFGPAAVRWRESDVARWLAAAEPTLPARMRV